MSTKYRPNRKASDADILRLNSAGLSLSTIGLALDCHPTSVAVRLKSLNIPRADTRRAFMEDILATLPHDQQQWLVNQLGPNKSIKDLVRQLIVQHYIDNTTGIP